VLPPWFENVGKRQIRSPKIFLRDPGILHALLQIRTLSDLEAHPQLGASWEGFALEQVVTMLETRDTYFWATHGGAELDLLVMVEGKRFGFEFKYSDAPGRTRSMAIARKDLGLERLFVVFPGPRGYELDETIAVVPLRSVPGLVDELRNA
jgi:predicted AAA+ superfamily ATPase